MLDLLRADLRRYASIGGWKHLGFWVGATYRFGAWTRGLRFAPARVVLSLPYRLLRLFWRLLLHVDIPAGARIGPGLCLMHPRDIMIPHGVEIGANLLVFHEVTIGTGPRAGLPTLGDDVDLYVGARVLGGVRVGHRSMIGANCVVMQDVPADSVVAPPPTRVIPRALIARNPGASGAATGTAEGAPTAQGADVSRGPGI